MNSRELDTLNPTDSIEKTRVLAQNTILNKIFGNNYINIKSLLSSIASYHDDCEFEIRINDEHSNYGDHTSLSFWNIIPSSQLQLLSYSDDVVITYNFNNPELEPIPFIDTIFRKTIPWIQFTSSDSSLDSVPIERKTFISSFKSQTNSSKNKSSTPPITPIIIKLSIEKLIQSNTSLSINNYERRQRCSFIFKDPELSNWRIDKTIRYLTLNSNSKKLYNPLEQDNCINPKQYDIIDFEIEYIGDPKHIEASTFKLFESLNPTIIDFSIDYILLKTILHLNPTTLLTNYDIITRDLISNTNTNEFIFSYNLEECKRILLIIFNNSVYKLSSNSFIKLIDYSTNITCNSIVVELVKCNRTLSNTSKIPIISVMECYEYLLDDTNLYLINDAYVINSKMINKLSYLERLKIVKNYITSSKNEFIINKVSMIPFINIDTSKASLVIDDSLKWNDVIDKINDYNVNVINSKFNSKNNIKVNGIVCKKVQFNYNTSKHYILRKKQRNSIIFKLFYDTEFDNYKLYLINDKSNEIRLKLNDDITESTKMKNISVRINYLHPTEDNFIPFQSLFEDLGTLSLSKQFSTKGFTSNELHQIYTLIDTMSNDKEKYHDSIIKLRYGNGIWVPYELTNKQPSKYSDGNICSMMLSNDLYSLEQIKYGVVNEFNSNYQQISRQFHNLINRLILEKYINDSNSSYMNQKSKLNSKHLLIFIDPMNPDLNQLVSLSGCDKIDIISDNSSSLIKYADIENIQIIPSTFKTIKKINGNINIKLLNHELKFDYKMIHNMSMRFVNIFQSFDCIYIQDANVFTTLINWINFLDMVKYILSPNGSILIHFIDSDIFNELSKDDSQSMKGDGICVKDANIAIDRFFKVTDIDEGILVNVCDVLGLFDVYLDKDVDESRSTLLNFKLLKYVKNERYRDVVLIDCGDRIETIDGDEETNMVNGTIVNITTDVIIKDEFVNKNDHLEWTVIMMKSMKEIDHYIVIHFGSNIKKEYYDLLISSITNVKLYDRFMIPNPNYKYNVISTLISSSKILKNNKYLGDTFNVTKYVQLKLEKEMYEYIKGKHEFKNLNYVGYFFNAMSLIELKFK